MFYRCPFFSNLARISECCTIPFKTPLLIGILKQNIFPKLLISHIHMYYTMMYPPINKLRKSFTVVQGGLFGLWLEKTKEPLLNMFKTFYYTMLEVVMKRGLEKTKGPTGTLLDSTMLFAAH